MTGRHPFDELRGKMPAYSELLEASREIAKHLKASGDLVEDRDIGAWVKRSRADELRREAELIEAKDAAILRFRAALAAFPECLPAEDVR